MKTADLILKFYAQLELKNTALPPGIKVMNPYADTPEEIEEIIRTFYYKYYNDEAPRELILGINPGRFGAGITGIPFTDSYRLKEHCGISFPLETRETSSAFVYDVISYFGGAREFYSKWFIGAVCPLGFIHLNSKGNWVNYNYYDDSNLERIVRPFIIQKLREQADICKNPDSCIVLGTGKNYKYLKKLNGEIKLFKNIIPLEHPRYIMQYKLKSRDSYVEKFNRALKSFNPPDPL